MSSPPAVPSTPSPTWLDRMIRFCLENKLVVFLVIAFLMVWGMLVAPLTLMAHRAVEIVRILTDLLH